MMVLSSQAVLQALSQKAEMMEGGRSKSFTPLLRCLERPRIKHARFRQFSLSPPPHGCSTKYCLHGLIEQRMLLGTFYEREFLDKALHPHPLFEHDALNAMTNRILDLHVRAARWRYGVLIG